MPVEAPPAPPVASAASLAIPAPPRPPPRVTVVTSDAPVNVELLAPPTAPSALPLSDNPPVPPVILTAVMVEVPSIREICVVPTVSSAAALEATNVAVPPRVSSESASNFPVTYKPSAAVPEVNVRVLPEATRTLPTPSLVLVPISPVKFTSLLTTTKPSVSI